MVVLRHPLKTLNKYIRVSVDSRLSRLEKVKSILRDRLHRLLNFLRYFEEEQMRFLVDTVTDVVNGPGPLRVKAVVTFISVFALGAYLTSTATYYLTSPSLPHSTWIGVAGGALAALVASCKIS